MNANVYVVFDRVEAGVPVRCWLVASHDFHFNRENLISSLGIETASLYAREVVTHVPLHAIAITPAVGMFGAMDSEPRELGMKPCAMIFDPRKRYDECLSMGSNNARVINLTNQGITLLNKAINALRMNEARKGYGRPSHVAA